MATGYVNRGFVLNDLREAEKATQDFQIALKLQPDNGQAHLGLAIADLQLRRPKPALTHLDAAQKILGNSRPMHLARAEAFRQEQDFPHAAGEYRIALSEDQNDLPTELAYADSLYRMRRYDEATEALNTATKLSPSDSSIYALRAQIYAKQGKRDEALRDIESAERFGGSRVETFTATGEAFLALGDTNSAMQRFLPCFGHSGRRSHRHPLVDSADLLTSGTLRRGRTSDSTGVCGSATITNFCR